MSRDQEFNTELSEVVSGIQVYLIDLLVVVQELNNRPSRAVNHSENIVPHMFAKAGKNRTRSHGGGSSRGGIQMI